MTAIHQQVDAARRGELVRVITRMTSGWAVLGDPQITRGYCLLLPDPVVPHLNALIGGERDQFLRDMTALGDAILAVTGAERINYEILGNVEPALHAHVIPRHASEDPDLRKKPVWLHDWTIAPPIDAEALALASRIAHCLAAPTASLDEDRRSLTRDPRFRVRPAGGYRPDEPLSEDEWPEKSR
jgi:diadenosine tetraphosphate (Ap4A) HIT family hydrolase